MFDFSDIIGEFNMIDLPLEEGYVQVVGGWQKLMWCQFFLEFYRHWKIDKSLNDTFIAFNP